MKNEAERAKIAEWVLRIGIFGTFLGHGIFALMMAAAVGALFTTILGSDVVSSSLAVKQQGDFAISQMGAMLRNSTRVVDPCEEETITIVNRDATSTVLAKQEFELGGTSYNALASGSSMLTNETVSVDSLRFTCANAPLEGISSVKIEFTLSSTTGRRDTNQAFETTVGLRRY